MKKLSVLGVLALLFVILLTGCSTSEPITAESTGIWNSVFVYPLSKFLLWIGDIFGGTYGLAIIILTIIVRLCLLPLTIKQQKSAKAMQAMQPEIKKLQEKYKDNKTPEAQKQMQREMMELYTKSGTNPLAGCLPALIQMPIFLALYNSISRTQQIKEHSFLWFELGQTEPYYILAVLAALTTFLSFKISASSMPANGGPNPMKMMLYIMPVMIFVGASSVPSALSLYWVVSGTFTIIQSIVLKKVFK